MNEIEVEEGVYISEGSDDGDYERPPQIAVENSGIMNKEDDRHSKIEMEKKYEEGESERKLKESKPANSIPKKQIRSKWPNRDKKLVLDHFKTHIEREIAPKKHENEHFVEKYRKELTVTELVKIKTSVYNTFRLTS